MSLAERIALVGDDQAKIMEQVVATGDLEKLTPAQRVAHYINVCDSLGLNWRTQPLMYLRLNGKLTLYANRSAADQLRRRDTVSIEKPEVTFDDGLCIVAVTARTPDGRTDSELGVVAIEGLRGDSRANAILKAITKSKRRVTLSICGLGWLDATEIDTIKGAEPVSVDLETGAIAGETVPESDPRRDKITARYNELAEQLRVLAPQEAAELTEADTMEFNDLLKAGGDLAVRVKMRRSENVAQRAAQRAAQRLEQGGNAF